MCIYF